MDKTVNKNPLCYFCEEEIRLVEDNWHHVHDGQIRCSSKASPANMIVDVDPPTEEVNPNMSEYTDAEMFCAGSLSTMARFDQVHPAVCLVYVRRVLEAFEQWKSINQ